MVPWYPDRRMAARTPYIIPQRRIPPSEQIATDLMFYGIKRPSDTYNDVLNKVESNKSLWLGTVHNFQNWQSHLVRRNLEYQASLDSAYYDDLNDLATM